MAHDLTSCTDISCIIEHHIGDELAEKPPPPNKGNFFDRIYPFQAISSNFGFCGRKAPPPRLRENFLTSDLSVSGNFEQLWFLWQKSPPRIREKFLTSDLSIWGNFEQLSFLWQKSPPPQVEGKFFDFRSIHFRQFWATLVFVAEKSPPPFLPFCHWPGSHHTGRIPKVPILQIHTQIPPIWISSIGYQLFKILTYTELQDSGSWCIWKVYRQPYYNTH